MMIRLKGVSINTRYVTTIEDTTAGIHVYVLGKDRPIYLRDDEAKVFSSYFRRYEEEEAKCRC